MFEKIQARFIPAGAGNTHTAERAAGVVTVYPRWRGEHANPRSNAQMFDGLSPLARGTLRQDVGTLRDLRFIPAGAGNTGRPLIC